VVHGPEVCQRHLRLTAQAQPLFIDIQSFSAHYAGSRQKHVRRRGKPSQNFPDHRGNILIINGKECKKKKKLRLKREKIIFIWIFVQKSM